MIINKSIYLFLFTISLSCSINDNTRTYQLRKINKPIITEKGQAQKDKSTKLIWEKPASWIPSEGSSMRLASFAIPYSGGTGDLSVIQLGGDGGGLEENVIWVLQIHR